MSYLYLIQKKEFLNKNIYKIGLIKSLEKVNKNHKIIFTIKDDNNLIKLNLLNRELSTKFQKYEKKNYFMGDSNELQFFISQYVKNLCVDKADSLYQKNRFELIKNIMMSNTHDTVKYEQISRLCNKKLEVRNIIFDPNFSNTEKYDLINDLLHNNKLNNFGNENIDYLDKNELIESLKDSSFIELLNKYVQLVHFDRFHPENHNIKYDQKDVKLYENFEWKLNKNNVNKVLKNSIKKIYLIVFVHTLQNSSDDLLYSKGMLILKKINTLLNI